MTDEIRNCAYCSEGERLDAFGIKIGELPISCSKNKATAGA